MSGSSSIEPDERSDVAATRQATSPPTRPPRLHRRLIGSPQEATAEAASIAVVEVHSHDVLAQAQISPEGSFEIAKLPVLSRGRSLNIEVAPRNGAATIIARRGTLGPDSASLSPSRGSQVRSELLHGTPGVHPSPRDRAGSCISPVTADPPGSSARNRAMDGMSLPHSFLRQRYPSEPAAMVIGGLGLNLPARSSAGRRQRNVRTSESHRRLPCPVG